METFPARLTARKSNPATSVTWRPARAASTAASIALSTPTSAGVRMRPTRAGGSAEAPAKPGSISRMHSSTAVTSMPSGPSMSMQSLTASRGPPPGASSRTTQMESMGWRVRRPPVNLNALSGPSGNLELYQRFPLARLKVRNRVSERNEGTKPYHGTDLRARPMSQTYDPNYPGHGQGYLAGPDYAGGPGYPGGYQGAGFGAPPPPPPPRSRKRGLIITGAVALAAGATAGGLIGSMNKGVVSTATATSNMVLSASQIAQRVDPALVDIVSTDSAAGSTSAGTGIVLTANGEILTNNHVIR